MFPFITYKNNRLVIDAVDVENLTQKIPTPFYVYSASAMRKALADLKSAVHHPRVAIHYALKANSNIAVLKTLYNDGIGMDVVSAGEIKRCQAAGVDPSAIVFSGVGKSAADMDYALRAGIHQFNVESLPEITALHNIAQGLGKKAPVAVRINPDVDAKTHAKITTGNEENKFGINWDQALEACRRVAQASHLEFVGITTHIGSQITDATPFKNAFARVEEMVAQLRQNKIPVARVSLGGGLGIGYHNETIPLADYGKLVHDTAQRLTQGFDCMIELEPGRVLVGAAGVLITKVLYVKEGEFKESLAKKFLIVDAAMNDLIRPTLYEAYHPIDKVVRHDNPVHETYDIVGPVCETGDYLAQSRSMPACRAGEHVAIFCAGAYGASMASTYNSRNLIAEVLIDNEKFSLIRPALTIEKQIAWEYIPEWL